MYYLAGILRSMRASSFYFTFNILLIAIYMFILA
jgi:hypothetical protein